MANRYWVGGSGTWDKTTTTHWSATSGGSGGASAPTSSDNVYFDANSGGGTCSLSSSPVCNNLNTVGYTGTISGSSNLLCYGSLESGSGTNWNIGSYQLRFYGSSTHTIKSNGAFLPILDFNNSIGTYNLIDNCVAKIFRLNTKGIINTNNYNITCENFTRASSSNTGTVNLGSSIITITGTVSTALDTNNSNLTFNQGTSQIIFTDTSTSEVVLNGGGKTFYNVWFNRGTSTGTNTIDGSNTFQNELKDTGTVAHNFKITSGTTQTLSSASVWKISGNAGQLITVYTNTASSHTISCSSGVISANYLNLKYSTATGGATFYAGANSTDGGNNSGWIFQNAPMPIQINIGDTWKTVESIQINIGDSWKEVTNAQINIGDTWKTIY